MLEFVEIGSPKNISDAISASPLDELAKDHKKRVECATEISKKFLEELMEETINSKTPKMFYDYPLCDITSDLKDMAIRIDAILFSSFQKNAYATPEVYASEPSEDRSYGKIVIDASMAVRTISINDMKIMSEIKELILNNFHTMKNGNPCIYTGLDRYSHTLPQLYVSTRLKHITDDLKEKGYDINWESTSHYVSIGINKE